MYAILTCAQTNLFSKIPELVGCGDPGVPVYGYKIGENYWAGEMVTFACDAGYHLEGPTNRLCLENGNWSNVVPACKRGKLNSICIEL